MKPHLWTATGMRECETLFGPTLWVREREALAAIEAARKSAASEKQSPEALKAAYHEGYQDALNDMRSGATTSPYDPNGAKEYPGE